MAVSQAVSLPMVMGVLNATPDSFSDGGLFLDLDAALNQIEIMIREGADIIDVGGESTRPGAESISANLEMERVLPVIAAIQERFAVRISVDTTKFEVAREAVSLGATIINDVSGGADIRLAELVKNNGIDLILMHKKGDPTTMQTSPRYPNGVVTEVKDYLRGRVRAFRECGVEAQHLWVDPGIGFGKTAEHNLDLLRHLKSFVPTEGRLVIGTSRKSFLAKVLGDPKASFEDRREGTMISNLWAYTHGASVFRVHEVGPFRRSLKTWEAILYGLGESCASK